MKRLLIILIAVCALHACAQKEAKVYEGTALGVVNKDIEVEALGGSCHVDVYSNGTYAIAQGGASHTWISFPSSASGDDGFDVEVLTNDGVPRVASLVLSIGEHRDTVIIKQHGTKEAFFSLDNYGITLEKPAGRATLPVNTNIPLQDIVLTPGQGTDWIISLGIDQSGIHIDYAENATGTLRKGTFLITYSDGWGDKTEVICYITQKSGASDGRDISHEELRSLATEAGTTVTEDLFLEGLVVSNRASGNMGDNEQLSTISIDYSICQRTVYLESTDGKYGVRILTKEETDNPFLMGDLLKIDLKGTKVFKREALEDRDPVFYYIEGLQADMIVSRETGSALPEKIKQIHQLTDDDIFTYVTLTEVELPVRKGPLTPLEEGFTNASENNRCAKFPVLLRGRDGEHMYVYTNTTCPYRRDGSRLPYGSGSMSGVIVHERYTRFAYNDSPSPDTYGYIGRYQVRHTSKEDFKMADTMEEESFSGLLAEWRYVTEKNLAKYPVTGGSDKSAYFTHTYEYGESSSLYGRSCVNLTSDLSYLGPVGTSASGFFGKNAGNKNGLGVILDDGTDWMGPDYTGINSSTAKDINNSSGNEGKGIVPAKAGSAWYVWYNRNVKDGSGVKSWLINFSTKGIESDVFSVQLSMINTADGDNFGPRYWYLEYSFTDSTGNAAEGWTTVERFCVPDRAATQPFTQYWMLPGFKPMDFRLPNEIGNKEHVYLRLRPEDNIIGTKTAYEAAPSESSTMPWSAMNYIGVRYNK